MEPAFNQPLTTQKPQILFILGQPGSGKGTQCERLVRDFKFHHISVGDLMRAEQERDTPEASKIRELVKNGQLVPTEITVKLLAKALSQGQGHRYLVDGFPRGLEQAIVLEQSFREIDFILNFDCPEDILVERLLERGKTSGRSDDNEETIKKRVAVFNSQTKPALDMYQKFGRVQRIDALGSIQEVYNRVLPFIFPNLIFFFGAPVLGKSSVAKCLANRIDYTYIDLEAFYKYYKCSTQEKKLNQLIEYFSNSPNRNFVIDSFFENKSEINVFFNYFVKPKYVFHFEATKDQVDNNIINYVSDPKKKKFVEKKYNEFVQTRNEILDYFKNQNFFININANDTLQNIENNIVKALQPQVFVAKTQNNQELADTYLQLLEQERGFEHLNVPWLISKEIERNTDLGQRLAANMQEKKEADVNLQIELVRKIIFRQVSLQSTKKFVLSGFPNTLEEFQEFEKQCCSISFFINFVSENSKFKFDQKNIKLTPEAHYFSNAQYISIDENALELFDMIIQKRNKFGFVVGPSFSGKTLISKQLEQVFGYIYIDWEAYQTKLKEKLGGDDGPREDLPYDMLVEQLRLYFQTLKPGDTVVFDGFPFEQNLQAQVDQMLAAIGEPTFVVGLNYQKEFATKAYRKKKEMEAEAEFTEEDNENLNKIINYGIEINNIFNTKAEKSYITQYYKINAETTPQYKWSDVTAFVNNIFYKRVVVCDVNITGLKFDRCWKIYSELAANVCTKNDILFIDVRKLLQDQYNFNGQYINQLKSQYQMRWTNTPVNYPSNYTPDLVISIIKAHLEKFKTPIRNILLFGYPSADNYSERSNEEQYYPRVIDEVKYIEQNLGPIRIKFQIVDETQEQEYNDAIQQILKIDLPMKVEKKAEGAEGEGEGEAPKEEAPADGEEGEQKKKFNPAEFTWTMSDGVPKNLAQIFHKKSSPQEEVYEFQQNDLSSFEQHLSQYLNFMNEGMNINYSAQFVNCFQ